MQNVIFIQVETLADLAALSMNPNFICQVAEDGGIYRGDPEGGAAIKVFDQKTRIIREVNEADQLQLTDFVLECKGTSYDINLPSAVNSPEALIFYINNNASGTINLVPDATDGIQTVGNFPYPILSGESVCICMSRGSSMWLILSKSS